MLREDIFNGLPMLVLCGIAMLIVIVQPLIFLRMSWKHGKELGINTRDMKGCVKSSAMFSVVPTLPILINYLILLPAFGKYFAWLRLSVMGNAAYETAVADMAATGLGCDGYGAASAVGISLVGALIVEVILTCIFVLSVLGSTADERTAPYAGIIIGLTLAFVHIMGIPLTGTSVNPARSFGPALMMAVSGDAGALSQVWVFIAAPLAGAALAALIWMGLKKRK